MYYVVASGLSRFLWHVTCRSSLCVLRLYGPPDAHPSLHRDAAAFDGGALHDPGYQVSDLPIGKL